jgi:hypothetical protein
MNASTLIAQYRDRIERRWGNRLSPDLDSEWEEKMAPGENALSDFPVPQPLVKKGATWGRRFLGGMLNLAMLILDTSWCQLEVQFFNDYCKKNFWGRW